MFQFTHPQGVRFPKAFQLLAKKVSIHAPARGAMTKSVLLLITKCFNSRTRKGCDICSHSFSAKILFQFTHPQGVRYPVNVGVADKLSFNSRTRKGCDLNIRKSSLLRKFQFTHPQGVRSLKPNFKNKCIVSIHAPARGAITN